MATTITVVQDNVGLEYKSAESLFDKLLSLDKYSAHTLLKNISYESDVYRKAVKFYTDDVTNSYISTEGDGDFFGICIQLNPDENIATVVPLTEYFEGYLVTISKDIVENDKLSFDNNGYVVKYNNGSYNLIALSKTITLNIKNVEFNLQKEVTLVRVVYVSNKQKEAPAPPPPPPKVEKTQDEIRYDRFKALLQPNELEALQFLEKAVGTKKAYIFTKINRVKVKNMLNHLSFEMKSCSGQYVDINATLNELSGTLKRVFRVVDNRSVDAYMKEPPVTCHIKDID